VTIQLAQWLAWPFPTLKYKYISQVKYRPTEAILSYSTLKLFWLEISKMARHPATKNCRGFCLKKGKGSPYSITESRVPELIPVHGSQPAGDVSHKPGGRLPLLSARPAVTTATLRGLLPILLLGEQRHDGCEQFA